MNITAIITSRWNSKRLPGKALADICGRPMLQRIVDRVRQAKLVDEVIIATTATSRPIIEYCVLHGIPCYAGSEDDVLDRVYQTAKHYQGNVIVYVWGDCPLVNAEIIDEVIKFFIEGHYDYAYNTKYPEGQTVAVISLEVLEKAWKTIKDLKDREWIHSYFTITKDFKVGVLEAEKDWSHIKLSVDTKEDLERVRKIYEVLQEVRAA